MKTSFKMMLAAAIATTSCSKDDGDENYATKKPVAGSDDTVNETSQLAEDEDLAGDTVSAQVDEAIAAAAEEQSEGAAAAGLALTEADKIKRVERYRNCTAADDKAVVEIKRAAERSWSFENALRQGSSEIKHLVEITRTWSRDEGEVGCAESGKHAALVRAEMKGVKLEASFKRQRSQLATITNLKKGVTRSRSAKFHAQGTRSITWADVSVADGTITLSKTITQQVTRTLEIVNKKGETKTFEQSVATDAAAPLQVVTVRDEAKGALVSRTIVSGKKIATGKDGGRIETSFDNVKYQPGKGCYAVSGKISGAIYAKDATEASLTFTIDFTTDTKSIAFSNGKDVEYVADGCEFDIETVEGDAGAVQEKAGAAEVTITI
jgi:hypothetical protein